MGRLLTLVLTVALAFGIFGMFSPDVGVQTADAHVLSYGHWHYWGDADWNTQCGPGYISGSGPANCYYPAESTKVCNANHKYSVTVREQYWNGSWNLWAYYFGSC